MSSFVLQKPQYGSNQSATEFNQDFRYIRITDIGEFGNLKNNDLKSTRKFEKRYLLEDEDILFARSGATAGKCFLYKKEYGKAMFAGYLIRFKFDKQKVLPKYVFYYTLTEKYQDWVQSIQRSAAQPNINSEEYKSLQIPLPLLQTQQKLVQMMDQAYALKKEKEQRAEELLDSIDDFVLGELGIETEKFKVKNQKLNKIFALKITQLKNNRFDPEYHLPKNKKLLQAVENGKFEMVKLEEKVKFISGYAFKSSDYVQKGIPLIRIQNIDEKLNPFNSDKFLPSEYIEIYKKHLVKKNDLLISMTGGIDGEGRVGKVSLVSLEKLGLLNQRCGIIRAEKEILQQYLFAFLRTDIFRKIMINKAVISVQVNISEKNKLKKNPRSRR